MKRTPNQEKTMTINELIDALMLVDPLDRDGEITIVDRRTGERVFELHAGCVAFLLSPELNPDGILLLADYIIEKDDGLDAIETEADARAWLNKELPR